MIIPTGQFKEFWDRIGSDVKAAEVQSTFQVPFKTLEEAVRGVIKFFGMSPCEGTDKVNVTERVQNLLMSGLFFGTETVLVRA